MKNRVPQILPLLGLLLLGLTPPLPAQFPEQPDFARAERELRAWADRGDMDAQFELGIRLITGEGVKKDEKAGLDYVTKAAEQGQPRAQHVMGTLYADGTVVKKDLAQAFAWFLKAAENGLPMAQHTVGVSYELGEGVEKDPAAATEWFKKAAAQNYLPSVSAYASKLERGQDGAEKDPAMAALLYLKAARQDYVPAMSRLAYLYYSGNGVPVDYRRAFGWYQRAARGESPWSVNDLAWFLATCPDESLQNGNQAVLVAKEALKMVAEAGEDQRYEMLDTVAAALARNGEFAEAVLWQKKALSLLKEGQEEDPKQKEEMVKELNDRLKLYQKQLPYADRPAESTQGTEPLPQDTILEDEGIPDAPPPPKDAPKKGKGTVV
ncbi:MAG: sel1 repeat family protein [Verrucomicrobiales bacterium]|nr:sel1 repeat family protein [Verrucomicrobiales bacterium]